MEENEYITKHGVKIKFVNIQGLLDRFRASHVEPRPPEYEAPTIGGGVERHPLTDQTAETDVEKKALAEHRKLLAAFQEKVSSDFVNLVLQRGIEIEINGDEWARGQAQFGIDVPTDPAARRQHYLQTEVLTGSKDDIQEDITRIITGVLNASGVDKEATAQLEAVFRGDLAGPATPQSSPRNRPVAIQRKVSTSRYRGGKNGQADKLVRRPKRK
jgi:hypothetical protein